MSVYILDGWDGFCRNLHT